MRTKLRIQSLDEWELDGMEFECTLPIIKNKTIIFGAYNMNFEITDNIWYQLPEEYKRKLYNNYRKKLIKNMLVTITNITAYSFNIKFHDKLKDEIIMEEIYENFDRNRKIESFLPGCDFPYSSMSIYFQYLGEIYVEFDLDELIAYSEEERILGYSKLIKDVNRRKERENNTGKLEQIYNEQLIIKNLINKNIDELSKEETQKVLENFLLIDDLKYLLEVIKKSKEFEIIIYDKLKDEIEHWLRDIQIKIKTEEDEKIYQELKEILKEQL